MPIGNLREHPGESLRRNLTATGSGGKTNAGKTRQECQMQ